ncbi:SDR family NAD(P)-dependent oxidoreductase [Streptomyces sp. NPDC058374]|uniref:SDR family NAD(P)-dependent oxidoreductase n=1 Tax=unclassified Streptomyces TaxID=2593676 RepID=UPI0036662A0E
MNVHLGDGVVDRATYGPWAVIAGGSEGVGAELADRLGAQGIDLILVARKPGPLQATADRVAQAHGVQVRTLSGDLLDPDVVQRIRDIAAEVDVGTFIYNAGANTYGAEFVEGDLSSFQQVIDLNITRQLELAQYFGARLKKRGKGALVLVGSLSGYVGHVDISVYAAAKAFERIFAEGLWAELRPHGVHVLHAVLGLTRTPAMERIGLRMDLPGVAVADPGDIAEEMLARFGDGPVQVLGGNVEQAQNHCGPDRARLVTEVAVGVRRMSPR